MASKKPLQADRFKQICAEVAEHQGIAADSELCEHIATLRLVREQLTAAAIAGRHVNPEHLLKLDEALRQYLPPPKKPLALRVTFVGGQDDAPSGAAAVDGVQKCRHCGFEPKDHERWPRCPHCGWKTGADMLTMQWREPAMACAAPSPSPENAPAGSPRTANVIPLDAEQRAAELRAAARKDRDGYAPPPQQARVNYNNAGTNNESISAFMRRIEDSYR